MTELCDRGDVDVRSSRCAIMEMCDDRDVTATRDVAMTEMCDSAVTEMCGDGDV